MQLLVDTYILYDWLMGEIRDRHAIEVLETQGAYVSQVSIWELVIKGLSSGARRFKPTGCARITGGLPKGRLSR